MLRMMPIMPPGLCPEMMMMMMMMVMMMMIMPPGLCPRQEKVVDLVDSNRTTRCRGS